MASEYISQIEQEAVNTALHQRKREIEKAVMELCDLCGCGDYESYQLYNKDGTIRKVYPHRFIRDMLLNQFDKYMAARIRDQAIRQLQNDLHNFKRSQEKVEK